MKISTVHLTLLIISLTSACAKLDLPNTSSLNQLGGLNGLNNPAPTLKNINISKAVDAATDVGKAITMSDEEIQQSALGYSKFSDKKNKIAPSSSSYAKRLANLTNKHKNEDGLNLNFKVYMSKEVNAFSMADGTVRFYSGIMDLMNDDELRAILGHEIGHVKLGHGASRIKLAGLASGARKGVASSGTLAGALADEAVLGGTVEKLIKSQFSQSQETDSDEYSIKFLKKHGYNTKGAVTAFNKLAKLEGKSGFMSSLLASHPASEERAKHLAEITGEEVDVKVADAKADVKDGVKKVEASNDSAPSDMDHAKLEQEPVGNTNSENSYSETSHASYNSGSSNPIQKKNNFNKINSNSGWYVQVAAFKNPESAANIKNKLINSGYDVNQEETFVHDTKFHRVLVGPFSAKAQANEAADIVMTKSNLDNQPFVKFVQ